MINENRPFERLPSKRTQRQQIQVKNFAKQFKDRQPIKKFTDFMGENLDQPRNKEKLIKSINHYRHKIAEIYSKFEQDDLNVANDIINKVSEALPEEELMDYEIKIKELYDKYV
jgi:hypothetical protein